MAVNGGMKRRMKIITAVLAASALALPAAGCGSGANDTTNGTPTNYEAIPGYGKAINEALDAAEQTEQRARDQQQAIDKAVQQNIP